MATVTFEDERTKFIVRVRPATYKDDLNRLALQEKANAEAESDDLRVLATAMFTYPRLVCASPVGELTIDGVTFDWPPPIEAVLDMSVDAVNGWYLEVKRLNPDWFPSLEEMEKKVLAISQPTELSP
jgi:hypothetical protein